MIQVGHVYEINRDLLLGPVFATKGMLVRVVACCRPGGYHFDAIDSKGKKLKNLWGHYLDPTKVHPLVALAWCAP